MHAKDSTLVFKISAGINYCFPDNERAYYHPLSYGNGYTSLTNGTNTGFSAIVKAGGQKRFSKHTGALLQLSYYMHNLAHTTRTYSQHSENTTGGEVITIINNKTVTHSTGHNLSLSLVPLFYVRRFYFSPKLNFAGVLTIINKDRSYSTELQPGTIQQRHFTDKVPVIEFTGGTGLMIGYEIKTGKKFLVFFELQSDYYFQYPTGPLFEGRTNAHYYQPPEREYSSYRSNIRSCFTLGIRF